MRLNLLPAGAAVPSGAGLKVNKMASVSGLAASFAAGRLNVSLHAVVGGVTEDEKFSTDLAASGLSASATGCKLGLMTSSREWAFECKRSKADLASYTFEPKQGIDWKHVDLDLLLTTTSLKATAPLSAARPVT